MLQLVEKALNQVALTVQSSAVVTRLFRPLVGLNDGYRALFANPIDQRLPRIAPICDHMLRLPAFQQRLRLSAFVSLSGSQTQAQGIAQTIDGDMDLGTETTPTRFI